MPALFVGVALLLAGCDQADPVGAVCRVDVDTAALQEQRAAAGIADCEPGDGDADLPDVALPCLGGGQEVALSSIEGPAMINFWATTCGPCRKEMPALEEFHQAYGDQVAVLGVDYLESYPGAALDFAEHAGTTYPSLADPCGALQQTDLVINGLPTFVFVRSDGTIEMASGGKDDLAEIVELAEAKLDIDLAEAG